MPNQTQKSGSLRPRARLLRTFGDELISSEIVAIIELVKNAYDADATRVLVRFQEPLKIGKGRIEILDNGHGMTLETIMSAWMEPATLHKKNRTRSEFLGRRVLGEKGIGRFAASRLTNELLLITRRVETDQEITGLFDWSQFDDEEKYLDEVEILWEQKAPDEISPTGSIKALWDQDKEKQESENEVSGTILHMEGYRTEWGLQQFEQLRTGLARLIPDSPRTSFSIPTSIRASRTTRVLKQAEIYG